MNFPTETVSPVLSESSVFSEDGRTIVEGSRLLRGNEVAYASTGDGCVFGGEVQGPLSTTILQQAGLRLQRRFPSLRSRSTVTSNSFVGAQLELCGPDLSRFQVEEIRPMLGARNDKLLGLESIVEEQLNRKFATEQGFSFHVAWVPYRSDGGHVVVSVAEMVTDTHSIVRIYNELLRECARILQAPALKRYDASALDAEGPPPCLLDLTTSRKQKKTREVVSKISRLLSFVCREKAPPSIQAIPQDCEFEQYVCRCIDGDVDKYRLVNELARERKIDIRFLVGAAVKYALSRIIYRSQLKLPNEVPITMDFDIRSSVNCGNVEYSLGMLEGSIPITVKLREFDTLWALAARLQERGDTALSRGMLATTHRQWESKVPGTQLGRIDWLGGMSTGRANALLHIGRISEPITSRIGPLTLRRTIVAKRNSLRSSALALWITNTDDSLTYCYTSPESTESETIGNIVLLYVRELLENSFLESFQRLTLVDYAVREKVPEK
jgi:hypothetical protein